MAIKQIILDARMTSALALHDFLGTLRSYGHMTYGEACARGALTKTQARAILAHVADLLPCRVKIEQRTPFGVAYVTLPGRAFDVDKAGKVLGAFA